MQGVVTTTPGSVTGNWAIDDSSSIHVEIVDRRQVSVAVSNGSGRTRRPHAIWCVRCVCIKQLEHSISSATVWNSIEVKFSEGMANYDSSQ